MEHITLYALSMTVYLYELCERGQLTADDSGELDRRKTPFPKQRVSQRSPVLLIIKPENAQITIEI